MPMAMTSVVTAAIRRGPRSPSSGMVVLIVSVGCGRSVCEEGIAADEKGYPCPVSSGAF
jgi:hypothetical protein